MRGSTIKSLSLPLCFSNLLCTNQCTLIHSCQNAPRRRHVTIGVPWFAVDFPFFGVSKVYQSVFRVPISVRCTNQRLMYQSAYPGTPLPKRPVEASPTNQCTLVHPCQTDSRRHDVLPIVQKSENFEQDSNHGRHIAAKTAPQIIFSEKQFCVVDGVAGERVASVIIQVRYRDCGNTG